MTSVIVRLVDTVQNWILDGFPRTLGQGQQLDPLLRQLRSPLNLVVNLDVPDEVILSRIAGMSRLSAAQLLPF